ncbi:proteasome subunit beta [Mycobacterium sp. 4D054]|uniref:proteasome subunit beta n=1 Tax=unclassified Mycobacterium TaxID=2642494 RepID=UPI0037C71D6C
MTWPERDNSASPSSPLSGAYPAFSAMPISRSHGGVNLSSFSDFLRHQAPHLLPGSGGPGLSGLPTESVPHGTTIVALKYPGGVVMAGDRRATQGNMIASRDVQKVYITDDYTVTGIAGTAAIAVEFARLYAVELEHYEKLEGVPLTFPGKVNRLATMVRGNLGAALQGFVALPLLAGYDLDDPNSEAAGRIVSFDAAGGWNFEEEGYQSVGSGSIFAKSSMKKLYSQVSDADSALRVAVEALYDAADDDSATGGPDLVRGIYPTAVIIGADGAHEVPEERIAGVCREIIENRSRTDTFGHDARPTRGDEL